MRHLTGIAVLRLVVAGYVERDGDRFKVTPIGDQVLRVAALDSTNPEFARDPPS